MMQSQSSHSSRDSADMKRPKTAWGRFLEDYKKTVGGCEGIGKFNEIQKTASAMWKNMSQADKAHWFELEKIDADKYVQRRLQSGAAAAPLPSGKRKRASETKGYRRAFQFFVNEHRQQNPMYWSLFTFNQAQKELSAAWNAIPMPEKQKWFMLETASANKVNKAPVAPFGYSQPTVPELNGIQYPIMEKNGPIGILQGQTDDLFEDNFHIDDDTQQEVYYPDVLVSIAAAQRIQSDAPCNGQGHRSLISHSSSRSLSDSDIPRVEKRQRIEPDYSPRCTTSHSDSSIARGAYTGERGLSGASHDQFSFAPPNDSNYFFGSHVDEGGDILSYDMTSSSILDSDPFFYGDKSNA